ncbi:MAG: sugar isomerase [Lachnospiraceae bacterium]|nr:sugar isomerase [Lachnospiraceae bacterium]
MSNEFAKQYQADCAAVLDELGRTLASIDPASLERLADEILKAEQVFFVGVGRVLLSLQSVCKRLAHLGIKAHYVGEITEPAITKDDLLIVGSGSGASLFPLGIAKKARSAVDCRIVHIGSNPNSEMKKICDFMVRIPVRTKFYLEDEIDSCQPMTSLFEQSLLLVGDILAKMIIERQNLDMKGLWQYHANLE